MESSNQEGPRLPLLLNPTNISRNLCIASKTIIQLKVDFLAECPYLAIVLDESTTQLMTSKPVYCAIMAITRTFDWMIMYIGQHNTALATSAQEFF